jgi:signal transduction histidine kinase
VGLHVNGLIPSLHEFADNAEKLFSIVCHFSSEPEIQIQDDAVATQLYHIVQEAVNNAVKHGKAPEAFVELRRTKHMLRLSIHDTGRGFPSERSDSGGMGLQIMNYRAESIGASLQVRHHPHQGTLVTCDLPDLLR